MFGAAVQLNEKSKIKQKDNGNKIGSTDKNDSATYLRKSARTRCATLFRQMLVLPRLDEIKIGHKFAQKDV